MSVDFTHIYHCFQVALVHACNSSLSPFPYMWLLIIVSNINSNSRNMACLTFPSFRKKHNANISDHGVKNFPFMPRKASTISEKHFYRLLAPMGRASLCVLRSVFLSFFALISLFFALFLLHASTIFIHIEIGAPEVHSTCVNPSKCIQWL